jgi:hypothetical protein
MQWKFWDPNAMSFVGTIYGFQFLGPHVMAILGTTYMAIVGTICHGSSGDHMRWQYLDPHAMAFLGNPYNLKQYHSILLLGNTNDEIYGDNS